MFTSVKSLFQPGKAALCQFVYGILITFVLTFLSSETLGDSIAAIKAFLQRNRLRDLGVLMGIAALVALFYLVFFRPRDGGGEEKARSCAGQGWFFAGVLLNMVCIRYFQIGGGVPGYYILAICITFVLAVLRGAPKRA